MAELRNLLNCGICGIAELRNLRNCGIAELRNCGIYWICWIAEFTELRNRVNLQNLRLTIWGMAQNLGLIEFMVVQLPLIGTERYCHRPQL